MRHPLALAALVLALLGIELATGAVSLSLERLLGGTVALLRGEEPRLPGYRLAAGWLLLVAAAAVLGALVWAERAARTVRSAGPACPQCGSGTKRIRRRRRHRLLAHLLDEGLTRRSCARCGWIGLSVRT